MQRGFSGILILVGVLILAVVAGGAFFLGRQTSPVQTVVQTMVSPSPVPSQQVPVESPKQASPSPVDEIANWKTYTSTKYKYLIKYPTDWETYAYGYKPSDEPKDIGGERFLRKNGNSGSDLQITPSLSTELSYPTEEKFIKGFFDNRIVSSITVDGAQGTKVAGTLKGKNQEVVLFSKNGFIFEIQSESEDGAKVFDQILSTFKFLDQAVLMLSSEGQSCGRNAGAGGDAKCEAGLRCFYKNAEEEQSGIGVCVK